MTLMTEICKHIRGKIPFHQDLWLVSTVWLVQNLTVHWVITGMVWDEGSSLNLIFQPPISSKQWVSIPVLGMVSALCRQRGCHSDVCRLSLPSPGAVPIALPLQQSPLGLGPPFLRCRACRKVESAWGYSPSSLNHQLITSCCCGFICIPSLG